MEKKEMDNFINLLFVGRLVEEKGVFDLLKAINQLRITNYKLKIVGDGPLKNDLIGWIQRNGLQKKIFVNQQKYEDMLEVYRQADIFILPSKHTKTWEEQYGMVLVEAMASGLPIIAYDSGAIREVISDVGLLVKEGDINQLCKALQELVIDEKRRKLLSQAARVRAEQEFDRNKTARILTQLYKKLL
jgi:glycosyltransferase involved in cell wall biosynthesis